MAVVVVADVVVADAASVVRLLVVFGSSGGYSCYCWVCSFVASISISIVVFAVGPTLLLLLLFDSFRSNSGKFLLLFCLL